MKVLGFPLYKPEGKYLGIWYAAGQMNENQL